MSDHDWLKSVPTGSRISDIDAITYELKSQLRKLSAELIEARAENAQLRASLRAVVDEDWIRDHG